MKVAALDVHRSFSQVCILDKESKSLLDLEVESSPAGLSRLSGAFSGVERVALEASSHWGWVVDHLQGMGLDVVLSHPSKTKAIGSAKIKTDKIDARMLAHLLSADLLPTAHISSPEVREQRSYLRYRYALVGVRTQAKNRIHAVLFAYGLRCPCKDLFCIKGRKWLLEQEFAALHYEQICGYLALIDLVNELVKSVDVQIRPLAEQHSEAKLLLSIPGVSYYSALLIACEIDGVERFASAKHLVSYAGLCPSTRSSGGKERHGHITRTGSQYLRWIMVEAAQKAATPSSPLNCFWWSVAKRKGGGAAKVAVARKLLESVYQMLKTRQAFRPDAWRKGAGRGSFSET